MKFLLVAACLIALGSSQVSLTVYNFANCTSQAVAPTMWPIDNCTVNAAPATGSMKWHCINGNIWSSSYSDNACQTMDGSAKIETTCMPAAGTSFFSQWSCTGSSPVTAAQLMMNSIVTLKDYSDTTCTAGMLVATGYGFSNSNYTGSPPNVSPCVATTCAVYPTNNQTSYSVACTPATTTGPPATTTGTGTTAAPGSTTAAPGTTASSATMIMTAAAFVVQIAALFM